jgi:hypothetical protein
VTIANTDALCVELGEKDFQKWAPPHSNGQS